MKYDLRPMGSGEMLDRSLKIYLSNLTPLLTVSLVIMVPLGLLTGWFGSVGGESPQHAAGAIAATLLLTVVVNSLLQGALIQAVSDIYIEGRTAAAPVLGRAAARFFPLLFAAFFTGVAVGVGFVLCIVPAFIAAAALFATQCVVMLEKRGPFDALERSWKLSKDHRSRVFSTIFCAGLVTGILSFGVNAAVGLLAPDPFVAIMVQTLVNAVLTPYAVVVTILLYYDLRIRKEAFDLQVLAREMGVTAPASPAP